MYRRCILLNYGKHGTNSNLPYRRATASSASVVQAGEENGQRLDPDRDRGAIRPPPRPRGLSRRAGRGVWVVEGTEKVKLSDGSRLTSWKTSPATSSTIPCPRLRCCGPIDSTRMSMFPPLVQVRVIACKRH